MLLDAVTLDDPVIFCEHKFLYNHLSAAELPKESTPIGKARIVRHGRDVTVVTYSAMVHESLAAADELREDGYHVEVVDLVRSNRSIPIPCWPPSPARAGCSV